MFLCGALLPVTMIKLQWFNAAEIDILLISSDVSDDFFLQNCFLAKKESLSIWSNDYV